MKKEKHHKKIPKRRYNNLIKGKFKDSEGKDIEFTNDDSNKRLIIH